MVRLGGSLAADDRSRLTDLLLVNALDDDDKAGADLLGGQLVDALLLDFVLRGNLQLDGVGILHDELILRQTGHGHERVTQVQHELIALLDCLIADADDHQHLLIALGHTDDHIVQQRAGQTVQRTHLRFIVGAGDVDVTTLDLENVPKNEDGTVDYTQDFFEKPVNLTVSGQLEAEAMAMAFGKVYTFGPTFRAEKSFTTRHAAEFWMIEPEMAFCDLNGYMDNAEAMIKYVIRYVLDNCPDEMAFFNQFIDKGLVERLELVANSEFARISYTEAIEILKKNNKKFQYPVEWGVDIQTEHERYLTEVVYKKPVFVTDYPKEIKSFYMKQNADGKTVAAADMLVPGIGELIGGSQREEDYGKLVARMDELGMDKTNYEWYLNLRKFGGVEHAGYGLGFERMIMYLTGIQNIRDVLPFPRTAYGF